MTITVQLAGSGRRTHGRCEKVEIERFAAALFAMLMTACRTSRAVMHTQPTSAAIKRRYSCRYYLNTPIDEDRRQQLARFLDRNTAGPLGTTARIPVLAATHEDGRELRGLGAYGLIRNPTGFLVGAVPPGDKNLEGLGFLMERAVLLATELGLARAGWAACLRAAASPAPWRRPAERACPRWSR